MPVELLFMIFECLHPRELCSLIRTCKRAADCLLSKHNIQFWEASLKNAPELPARPEFIHLLYSPHCHVCGRANVRTIAEFWLHRVCSKCLRKVTVWYEEAQAQAKTVSIELSELFAFPSFMSYFSVMNRSWERDNERHNLLLQLDVDRVIKEYQASDVSGDQDAFKEFAKRLAHRRQESEQFVVTADEWLEDEIERAREAAMTQRFDEILQRLRQSEWGPDIAVLSPDDLFEALESFPIVTQATKLTDRGWHEVLEALGDFLAKTRLRRLAAEMLATLNVRFTTLQEAIVAHYVHLPRTARMDCRPDAIDLASMPACRAIANRPHSEVVALADFAAVLPALAEEWENDVRKELTGHIRKLIKDIPADVDPLTLAISLFRCSTCDERFGPSGRSAFYMQYPAILGHECCRSFICTGRTAPEAEEDLYGDASRDVYKSWETMETDLPSQYGYGDQAPYNVACLDDGPLATGAIERMRRIVSALGLDPLHATVDEVNQFGIA
ncbi:hypothetical protein BD413DRAFT_614734 [Trametes elegans]|nr:hypothetical protein BD413DRAFT_614734 [Trametes elegans]